MKFHHYAIQWGTFPEWLAAIGTLMAVFAAIWIATIETRASRKQNIISQAEKISAFPVTLPGSNKKVVISNQSNLPIHDVVLSYGVAYGAGPAYQKGNENQTFVLRVPPGIYQADEPHNPGGGMHTKTGIAISFRDSAGNFWRRDAEGNLVQTQKHPFRELDVNEPISDWKNLSVFKI